MILIKKVLLIIFAFILVAVCDSSIAQPKPAQDILLTNKYTNPNQYYTIKYPSDWSYREKGDRGVEFFNGSIRAAIGVDVMPVKAAGKKADTNFISSLVQNKWSQADPTIHFIDQGNVSFITENAIELTGQYFVAESTLNNRKTKIYQMIVTTETGKVFTILLAASNELFDKYKFLVMRMAETLNIGKSSP